MNRKPIGMCLLVLLLTVLRPSVAAAHTDLLRSEPANGAVLQRAPARVQLFFSEPLEREEVALEVYDAQRQRVDRRDAGIPAANVAALTVSLPALGPSTYSVIWRVMSIDGHVVRGTFAFSVGAAGGSTAASAVVSSGVPIELSATVRWWTFLAAFVLIGGLVFLPLVLVPALQAAGVDDEQPVQRASRRLIWSAWPAVILLLSLSLVALLLQGADASGQPLSDVFRNRVLTRLLTSTKFGVFWLIRIGILVGLLAVLAIMSAETRPVRWSRRLGLALGAALLLTIAATGHASAVPRVPLLAVGADWLHLMTGALWIGGLVQLAIALPPALAVLDATARRAVLPRVVHRFSWLASLSVVALVVTGTYAGLLHVPTWDALLDTIYGATLSSKLVLIVPLLALGAINLLILHPRFARAAAERTLPPPPPSRRSVKKARRAGQAPGNVEAVMVAAAPLHRPGRTGDRDQGQANPAEEPANVSLFRRMVLSEIGLGVLVLGVTGLLTSLPPAAVELASGRATDTLARVLVDALDPVWPFVVLALALLAGVFALWILWERVRQRRGWAWVAVLLHAAGLLGVAIGLPVLLVTACTTGAALSRVYRAGRLAPPVASAAEATAPSPAADDQPGGVTAEPTTGAEVRLRNPVTVTAASLRRGKQLYGQNCALCHGQSGRGDGPQAAALTSPPANLAELAPGSADDQLYLYIANGVPGTAMPPHRGKLSEEDIWHVVNYIRTLGQAGR